jgi:putative flippase GtrA
VRTLWSLVHRAVPREVSSFLLVGGLGYVTDIAAFNILLSRSPFDRWDPSMARVAAVAVAMVVTYCGNRWLTWRGSSAQARAREVALFVVFNVIGLGISTATLVLSHDVLGLTSRLDDNISANVVGVALGTLFRFWSYRRFVFAVAPQRLSDAPRDRLELSR